MQEREKERTEEMTHKRNHDYFKQETEMKKMKRKVRMDAEGEDSYVITSFQFYQKNCTLSELISYIHYKDSLCLRRSFFFLTVSLIIQIFMIICNVLRHCNDERCSLENTSSLLMSLLAENKRRCRRVESTSTVHRKTQ